MNDFNRWKVYPLIALILIWNKIKKLFKRNKNMNKVNTLKEAIDVILSEMSLPDREIIKCTKEDDLILYHHNIGMQIRNKFLLWDGNIKLAKDMGLAEGSHPDEVSQAIIVGLWKYLNKGEK